MIQKIVNTVDWDDWSDSTKHANSKIENNETMTKEKKTDENDDNKCDNQTKALHPKNNLKNIDSENQNTTKHDTSDRKSS